MHFSFHGSAADVFMVFGETICQVLDKNDEVRAIIRFLEDI